MSAMTFGALGVPQDLVAALSAGGINEAFPIQSAVIPDALAGRDVTGRAPTGSGKTLAFGIPLVANTIPARRRRPTALVLAPTRELAQQITTELLPLARVRGYDAVAVYGGVGYGAQRKRLDGGAELVVACPGRLEDLISMGALSLDEVRLVVVDEVDRMADMGFLPAVKRVLDQTHTDRQVLLFSATLDGAVAKLAASVQRDPVRHEVGPAGPDLTTAKHVFWSAAREDRTQLTAQIAGQLGSTMVFCRTRHGADRLAKQLARTGVTAASIHGGRSQPQRDRALREFVDGKAAVLVATDVAARGVHVDDVAAVVHYDPAEDAAAYVHRSGRTARAGASGVVVSFVERGTERDLRRMWREVGVEGSVEAPSPASLTPATGQSVPTETDSHTHARTERPERRERPTRPEHTEPRDRSVRHEGREVGTVAFFNPRRGYGFIDTAQGTQVFVHHTNTNAKMTDGQRVAYHVRPGRKGVEAFDVVAV